MLVSDKENKISPLLFALFINGFESYLLAKGNNYNVMLILKIMLPITVESCLFYYPGSIIC